MNSDSQKSSELVHQYSPRMVPNSPDKLNKRRVILLSLSFTTVLLAWGYFNLKVPILLESLIPAAPWKQSLKGFIMAMDNILAVILQPFFGSISDRTCSRFGRRMPYIVVGTLLSAFFLILLPWIQVLVGFVLVIFLFDMSMSIYRSVSVVILPDYTPEAVREKASALQQFIGNMGGVIGFTVPIIVNSIPNISTNWKTSLGFLIVGVFMIVILIVQAVAIRETPSGPKFFRIGKQKLIIDSVSLRLQESSSEDQMNKKEPPINIYKEIGELFKSPNKNFLYLLFTVFFAYLGFAGIESFFSTFNLVFLGKSESISSTLFLAYSVPMIISAPIWGNLGKKYGRIKACKFGFFSIILALIIFSAITAPLTFNPNASTTLESVMGLEDYLIMLNIALISMPWMCFIVNSFPIIWGLAPEGKTGSYTGIYYMFNQLAYTLGPMVMGVILDAFGVLGSYQYIIMFPFILICEIVAVFCMMKVKQN